ncbi:MAG: hypothetical protein NVS9B4_27010 [Candidatus Acidiferrum sp.]
MLNISEASADFLYKGLGFTSAPGLGADCQNIPPNIVQPLGIETKNFRAQIEARQHRGQVVRRCGANVAQILRDDKVRREVPQSFGIHCVDAFASGDVIAHETIDLCGYGIMGNA